MKLIKDNLGKVAITVDKDYWNSTKDYDRLVVVQRSSNSYTTYISRKPVPAGTPLTDRNYWIPFSHFQEDYADWTNELQRTLNEYKSSVANAIMFEANKDFIENGVVTTITFSITVAQIPQTNTIIKFYKNNVLVSTATVLPQQFDNTGKYQWTDNTSVESLYKVEVVVNGNTYVGLWKINVAYDFYIGTGVDHVNIISNPNYKHTGLNSLAGNYYLTSSTGDYIYIICINNIVPSNVKLSGFELPIAFYTTTTIDDKEYIVYRSLNTYQAESFTITINDVSYDNNSYIAHLIEELSKFKNKADETEEKVETIADEETITVTAANKVALKNRPMKKNLSNEVIQKGYVILKEGDDFKEVVESYTDGNVIFEIDYAYDLDGESVTISEGCVLKFEGGCLSNGELVGNGTTLNGNLYNIFTEDVTISGDWNVTNISTSMIKNITDGDNLHILFNLCSQEDHNSIHIEEGTYWVTIDSSTQIAFNIPKNTDIRLDGTIMTRANSFNKYVVFNVGNSNVHIYGHGSIVGDKDIHLTDTGQWGLCIQILGTENDNNISNITIEGVTLKNGWGDGIYIGLGDNVVIRNVICDNNRRQGITIISGNGIIIENCIIKNTNGHSPQAGIDVEPNDPNVNPCNIIVRNCVFSGNKEDVKLAVGRHTNETTYTNIIVENCQFFGADFCNLNASNCAGLIFRNNTIHNYTPSEYTEYDEFGNIVVRQTQHIRLDSCKDVVISNNVAYNLSFIIRWYDNIVIENNRFIDSCFQVSVCGPIVFRKNTIAGPKDYTVRVLSSDMQSYTNAKAGYTQFATSSILTGIPEVIFEDNYVDMPKLQVYGSENNKFRRNTFNNTFIQLNRDSLLDDNLIVFDEDYSRCSTTHSQYAIRTQDNYKFSFLNNHIVYKDGYPYNSKFFVTTGKVEIKGNVFDFLMSDVTYNQPLYLKDATSVVLDSNIVNGTVAPTSNWVYYPTAENVPIRSNLFDLGSLSNINKAVIPNTTDITNKGVRFFNTTINIPIYWNGTAWVNQDGVAMTGVTRIKGTKAQADAMSEGLTTANAGLRYYATDSNLKKYILWNGTTWTNLDGTALS